MDVLCSQLPFLFPDLPGRQRSRLRTATWDSEASERTKGTTTGCWCPTVGITIWLSAARLLSMKFFSPEN